jgi:type 2 lantibiotic biosynthesis protein LanM
VTELLSSGYDLLLEEFPVLGRLLATMTDLWLEGSEEMLRRIAANRLGLQQHFEIAPKSVLHRVHLGLSDPHRGGRAVAILTFGDARGDNAIKVVYKPKDMQVDQTYQQFLQTLNDASTLPPFRRLTVLNGAGYGFMEWVDHRPSRSDEELVVFYTNAGRTMAVLHLLGCTDCHFENLIACDDQLVLIDTETLLEADLQDLISEDGGDIDQVSDLQTSMQGSVLRSGLLPQWLMAGAGKKQAFDISALGIQPPPPELELPGWLGLNSDGMIAGRSIQPCELPTSLPVGLGSPQRLTDFVEPLCSGFTQQLLETIRLRPLLEEALGRFGGQPRRLVARATRLYFTVQRQMLEPASLRNAVAHGLKLEQLSRSFLLAGEKPLHWPLFQAELLQMERLDIPFFEHLIDGEGLPLPEGLAPIQGFMKASGLDAARWRLQALNQNEITFQEQLIRGAIAARHLTSDPQSKTTVSRTTSTETQLSSKAKITKLDTEIYRQEAFRLGEELWTSAIRDQKGRPEWLGMDLATDGESFQFGLIGGSLYSGTSGIALLFARLAQASPDPSVASEWRQRAGSCIGSVAEFAKPNNNDQLFRLIRDLPYGITGSGGILLALLLLAEAGIREATPAAAQLVHHLQPERLQADEGVDLIGGVTGLIGPLLLLGTEQGLSLARCCGDRLLRMQLECGGWPEDSGHASQSGRSLTGFSHGAAGMASALARLAQATRQKRYADAAWRAISYERSVFVEDQGNWPDFRAASEPNEFMVSWCHGAPGILLSRQVLRDSGLADEQTVQELRIARITTTAAIERTSTTTFDPIAHLCCGAFGLTTLLRIDSKFTGSPLNPIVLAAEANTICLAKSSGSYTYFNVDTGTLNLPGLLTGKAGVALALLEAAEGLRWLPQVLSAGLFAKR